MTPPDLNHLLMLLLKKLTSPINNSTVLLRDSQVIDSKLNGLVCLELRKEENSLSKLVQMMDQDFGSTMLWLSIIGVSTELESTLLPYATHAALEHTRTSSASDVCPKDRTMAWLPQSGISAAHPTLKMSDTRLTRSQLAVGDVYGNDTKHPAAMLPTRLNYPLNYILSPRMPPGDHAGRTPESANLARAGRPLISPPFAWSHSPLMSPPMSASSSRKLAEKITLPSGLTISLDQYLDVLAKA